MIWYAMPGGNWGRRSSSVGGIVVLGRCSPANGFAHNGSFGALKYTLNHAPEVCADFGSKDVALLGPRAFLADLFCQRFAAGDDLFAMFGCPQFRRILVQF